jgi:hypothetical protein
MFRGASLAACHRGLVAAGACELPAVDIEDDRAGRCQRQPRLPVVVGAEQQFRRLLPSPDGRHDGYHTRPG